jgi:hypothetical protein
MGQSSSHLLLEEDKTHQLWCLAPARPQASPPIPSEALATLACGGGAEPLAAQGMCHHGAAWSPRAEDECPGTGDRRAPA